MHFSKCLRVSRISDNQLDLRVKISILTMGGPGVSI